MRAQEVPIRLNQRFEHFHNARFMSKQEAAADTNGFIGFETTLTNWAYLSDPAQEFTQIYVHLFFLSP